MSAIGTLPGIYFDNVESPDSAGLIVANTIPEENSIDAPSAKSIALDILSTLGEPVDDTQTQVYVDGQLAWDGGNGGAQNGWIASAPVVGSLLADWEMEESGIGSWTVLGGVVTKESGSPGGSGSQVIKILDDSGFAGAAGQAVATSAGKWYRLRFWFRTSASCAAFIIADDLMEFAWFSPPSTAWTYVDTVYHAVADGSGIYLAGGGIVNEWLEFDNVSIEELPTDLSLALSKPSEEWSSEAEVEVRVVSAAMTIAPLDDGSAERANTDAWSAEGVTIVSKDSGLFYDGAQSLKTECQFTDPYGLFYGASQVCLEIGKTYRIRGRGYGTAGNVGLVHVYQGTTKTIVWSTASSGTWEEIDETFVADSDTLVFGFDWQGSGSNGWECWFDALTLEVVPDSTYSLDYTYSFTVEDTIDPVLVSARAVYADRIRVAFSEDMLRSSPSGAADALNPSNYEIEFVPATDVEAGVSASVVSIAIVNSTTFDVSTDIPLTFGKLYRITVGEIADDSSNANTVPNGSNVAEFSAWVPPNWPELRRFDLWSMLSDDDRGGDVSGDLARLISAFQDLVDLILWDLDSFSDLWDIDKAPIEFVEVLLADLGNPFDLDLDENKRRKLADLLVAIYKQKGTKIGVINLARFFTGLEITTVDLLAGEGWTLGESELGIDTYLAPSTSAPFYTFLVNVDRVLTDEEREILSDLIDYMKPAHTHFRIVEPTDPEFVDHWELGLSSLGEETYLH